MDSGALVSKGEPEVDSAWERYRSTGCSQSRETLILYYAPLVKYVAGRIAIGLPQNVDVDDLISFGTLGLVDAVDKFDPGRGVKFDTYAVTRIRGAIIDGLRSLDWVPRSVRQKAREIEQVVADLESRFGRPATDVEISEALDVTLPQYHAMLSEVRGTALLSLDEIVMGDLDQDEGGGAGRLLEDPESESPMHAVEILEVKRLLADAIDRLPERERLVVALYYYEGLTVKEIGYVLDVSESRVSQIHTKALLRLRAQLGRMRESLVS